MSLWNQAAFRKAEALRKEQGRDAKGQFASGEEATTKGEHEKAAEYHDKMADKHRDIAEDENTQSEAAGFAGQHDEAASAHEAAAEAHREAAGRFEPGDHIEFRHGADARSASKEANAATKSLKDEYGKDAMKKA